MTPNETEKLLTYFDAEEHLVRRLGVAVVSCWRDLPLKFRSMLMERAAEVLDDEQDESFGEHLRRFIDVHGEKTRVECRSSN